MISEEVLSIKSYFNKSFCTIINNKNLLEDLDLEQNVLEAVAVVDLQHRLVLALRRAVVDVLDLLPGELLQLEPAQGAVAVETGQAAPAGGLQDHDQDVGRVVGVLHAQGGLGEGRRGAAGLQDQRSEGEDGGGLEGKGAERMKG